MYSNKPNEIHSWYLNHNQPCDDSLQIVTDFKMTDQLYKTS